MLKLSLTGGKRKNNLEKVDTALAVPATSPNITSLFITLPKLETRPPLK